MRQWIAVSSAIAIAFAAVSVPTPAGSPTTVYADARHPSGIALVGLDVRQARPVDEQQATAWNDAYQFMLDNPAHISYPWIEPTSGLLELSATGDEGVEQLTALEPLLADAPHVVRTVAQSYAQLTELRTAVIGLKTIETPGSEFMFKIEPDEEANRLIVVMSEHHDAFISELAARFGTEAIAVRIDPLATGMTPGSHIRSNDASAFYGGARSNCSTAFAWNNGTLWEGMLTAAHCIADGGNVSTPADLIGNVTSGFSENWKWGNGNGTVPYTGETMMRGDVALIQLASGKDSVARMFRGGPDSATSSIVRIVWARWSRQGDGYCISARSGEICGYQVDAAGVDVWYPESGTWARNVVEGHKDAGTCTEPGDSGGAVFTVYNDGVAAKGVLSGMGDFFWACDSVFTDIQHPVQALPGGVSSIP